MPSGLEVGSGNGLLPDSTKPLPAPVLTEKNQWYLWEHISNLSHWKDCAIDHKNVFKNNIFKMTVLFPWDQWICNFLWNELDDDKPMELSEKVRYIDNLKLGIFFNHYCWNFCFEI